MAGAPETTRRRRALRLAVATGFALITLIGWSPAALAQSAEGEAVYRQNCAACHQVDGSGLPGTFPPLVGNTRIEDTAYVVETITNGREGEIVVDGVTYNGVMPAFGGTLSAADIEAVAAYIQTDLGTVTTATTLPPAVITPVPEAALTGERLFLGQEALENGGPACAACHAAGAHGDLVAVEAGFGPDLTGAWGRLGGPDGVVEAIRAHPGAAASVYGDGPLTVDEIGALASYLEVASGRESATVLDGLILIAAALLGLLVAATAVVAAGRAGRVP